MRKCGRAPLLFSEKAHNKFPASGPMNGIQTQQECALDALNYGVLLHGAWKVYGLSASLPSHIPWEHRQVVRPRFVLKCVFSWISLRIAGVALRLWSVSRILLRDLAGGHDLGSSYDFFCRLLGGL